MSLYPRSSRQTAPPPVGITEFEILKASHKFLRDEDEKPASWDEQLAGKYYSSLYREFAVCDLKHYKSGNFALRWRTEDEVLDGSGETTCGNTRCAHHFRASSASSSNTPPLTTLELPFTYQEHGGAKSALVKVVLCARCVRKLMWKRTQEKEKEGANAKGKERERGSEEEHEGKKEEGATASPVHIKSEERGDDNLDPHSDAEKRRRKKRSRSEADEEEPGRNADKEKERRSHSRRHKRSSRSRSRSPRRHRADPSHPSRSRKEHEHKE